MTWRRRGATERRGTPVDVLVVGLANPGSEYEGTRHNIGGDVVECIADRHGVTLKIEPRQRARYAEVTIGDKRVGLAIPTTYMNESGAAMPALLDRTGIKDVESLLVVHDELDLDPGRLQFKFGGGIAGHNGLRSLKSTLKTAEFARLRVGVGKPPHPDAGASWVLSRPSRGDVALFKGTRDSAADAVELYVNEGLERAMAAVNVRG